MTTTQQQTDFAPSPRLRFVRWLYKTGRISEWHTTVYRASERKEACPCECQPCRCERDEQFNYG